MLVEAVLEEAAIGADLQRRPLCAQQRGRGGRLSGSRSDPFHSKWLPKQFAPFKEKLMTQHELAAGIARERRGERWASLEPSLPRRISERMLKRAISMPLLLRARRRKT